MQTVHQYVNNISQQGSEDIPFPQLLRNMQQHMCEVPATLKSLWQLSSVNQGWK